MTITIIIYQLFCKNKLYSKTNLYDFHLKLKHFLWM